MDKPKFRTKPHNRFEIRDDHAVIVLERRTGETFETKVDLDLVESLIVRRWYLGVRGYAVSMSPKPAIYLHRYVMGNPAGMLVDHRDGNPLNNMRSNLRIGLDDVNNLNRVRPQKNNTSGFLGVTMKRGRWVAQIQVSGKNCYLGMFDDPAEAAEVVRRRREELLVGKAREMRR